MTAVAGVLIVLGSMFTMLAGVGTLRFDDVYARMHPAAKGPTLGLLLVAMGAAIELRSLGAALALGLVVVLQFLAAPVGAHLLGRAIHQRLPLQRYQTDELETDLLDAPDDAGSDDDASGSVDDATSPSP